MGPIFTMELGKKNILNGNMHQQQQNQSGFLAQQIPPGTRWKPPKPAIFDGFIPRFSPYINMRPTCFAGVIPYTWRGKFLLVQHLRGTKRGTLWPDIGIGKIPLASSVTGCKLMTYETRDAMRFALWKRFSTHQEIRHPGKIRNSRSSNQKRPCPLYFVGMQKGSIFLRTNISPKALGMSFLSHWWNMLVPWRVQGGPLPVISRVMGPQ